VLVVAEVQFLQVGCAGWALSSTVLRMSLSPTNVSRFSSVSVGESIGRMNSLTAVVVLGRHLHVDHGDVGAVRRDLAPEIDGIGALSDNIEPVFGQQAGQPFPQEQLILSHHDSERPHTGMPW
jgi:hypothetical protein